MIDANSRHCRPLGQIFTSDQESLKLFEDIRVPLAAMMVVMNMTVLLEKVPMAMKRAKEVLIVGVIGSWAAQVPLVSSRILLGLGLGLGLGLAHCGKLVLYRLIVIIVMLRLIRCTNHHN